MSGPERVRFGTMQTLSNTRVRPRDVRWYQSFAAELGRSPAAYARPRVEKYVAMGLEREVLTRVMREVFGIREMPPARPAGTAA